MNADSLSLAAWNLVRLDEVAPESWRNGGGTTRELLAWPRHEEWTARVSVAEIAQDTPFSAFSGVQRCIAVLDGAGVRLRVSGDRHTRLPAQIESLTPASAPFSFDGGASVSCALIDGPTQDLNLMVRGGAAMLERVDSTLAKRVGALTLIAVYANQKRAWAAFNDAVVELPARTLAWHMAPAGGTVRVTGRDALWMEVAA